MPRIIHNDQFYIRTLYCSRNTSIKWLIFSHAASLQPRFIEPQNLITASIIHEQKDWSAGDSSAGQSFRLHLLGEGDVELVELVVTPSLPFIKFERRLFSADCFAEDYQKGVEAGDVLNASNSLRGPLRIQGESDRRQHLQIVGRPGSAQVIY